MNHRFKYCRSGSSACFAALLFAALVLCPIARADSFVLAGGVIHTITGETYSPGQVLVKDGKISAVGTTVQAGGAKQIDLKGAHLFPGLIALNSSVGLVEINAVRATRDYSEVGRFTPDVQSWIAVNPDSELLPVARGNGITHFQPVPQGGMVAGQSGLVASSGWTAEDMTVKRPLALHVFWPGMTLNTTPKEKYSDKSKWKSLEDQAKERREKLRELDDFFADARAYAKVKDAGASGKKDLETIPAWEAMLPFVRGELPLIIHADEIREIKAALDWSGTNQFKIIIAGGRDAWRVAERLAERSVPVIYEHMFNQPTGDNDDYDVNYKSPARLRDAGVTVAFSEGLSSSGAQLLKNLPYSAAQAVAFGLSRDEAMKGVTIYPAQIAGVADRLGSIEPGKDATFFVATGDILDIRSQVTRMWIAGKEVSLESRHTRLYEKYRNRPKPE